MFYKNLWSNNGLFIYSKYIFQVRHLYLYGKSSMFKESTSHTIKNLEISRKKSLNNFDVVDSNPEKLSQIKALSQAKIFTSQEDRMCEENKSDKLTFPNNVTDNALASNVEHLSTLILQQAQQEVLDEVHEGKRSCRIPRTIIQPGKLFADAIKVKELVNPAKQLTPSKVANNILNKKSSAEPFDGNIKESEVECNPDILNKVRLPKFVITGKMRSDRIISQINKILSPDTCISRSMACTSVTPISGTLPDQFQEPFDVNIKDSELESDLDILNKERTSSHKKRLRNLDKFANTGKIKSDRIKSEINEILSSDTCTSKSVSARTSITPISAIHIQDQLQKQKRSPIQDRLLIRCNKNLEHTKPANVSAINSARTLSLDKSFDKVRLNLDSDLELIVNRMKSLTINALDEMKENYKRILTHNTRMNIFKEFVGCKLEAVDNRRLLKGRRTRQQNRYLSTSSTTADSNNNDRNTVQDIQISQTLTTDEELNRLRPESQETDVNTTITELKKVPLELKHIEVKSYSEIQPIHDKFPFPKNILNNYYAVLSDQLKDKSLKVEAHYNNKQGTEWVCMYHMKWPENCKVSAKGLTKKRASTFAALKCLSILSGQGKISPDGLPLIYTNEEVKKLTQKTQPELKLDDYVIKKMQNIIGVFNDEMTPFLSRVDYSNYEDQRKEVLDEQESIRGLRNSPRYIGMHQYFAKENMVLPISKLKDTFIKMIQNNNCVIVKGEPGCGKSSRVPQYVLEAWVRDAASEEQLCRIAVTQPRRIAAISLAERVASERDEQLGHIVGYQVRLKSNFQPHTGRILYCTTGILLRYLQSDPNLTKFSHVILDEAHERDVNTDLLMTMMKKAMNQNNNLKVVVMSATIDADEFSAYFNGAPVFNVPGFTYPVNKHYLNDCKLDVSKTVKMCNGENPRVIHEDVAEIIGHLHKNKPEGAILTFLPGWEDLVKVQKLIPNTGDVVVYLVHSKLKDSEQHKIFSRPPPGVRKIILATNIAETSITIDDVVYVVDTGIHKDQIFDNDKGISIIDMEWISKASANQRAGRAGRCSPGESYHLYTKERFNQFPDYSSPKILNSSLTKIVLDSKVFSNNMDACDFMNGLITPPEKIAVERAVDELKQLELLDKHEKLTPLGETLVNFQLEPRLAKVMVNAVVFKCTTPIVDIVTLFSSDAGIFGSLALTDKDDIKKVKSDFCKSSDHLALMRVYEKWLELYEEEDAYRANGFCRRTNLVPHKLQFVHKLKEIHNGYLYNGLYASMPLSEDYSDNDEMVKAVLYSGTGTVLQHRNWDIVKSRLKTNANVLVTRNNHKATITAESVNYKRHKFPSDFLVYINETRSNIRRTTIVRECSLIPPISVLLFSNKELEILKVSKSDNVSDNQVIVGIKDTKLQFICDETQAEILIDCKKAIDGSYKYLIHQLTYAGEEIPEFLKHWDNVLVNLGGILERFRIE